MTGNDRERLLAIIAERNSPQKHVWRAWIVLMTADGHGTTVIMRQAGVAKTAVRRWQERFMQAGWTGCCATRTDPRASRRCRRRRSGGIAKLTASGAWTGCWARLTA